MPLRPAIPADAPAIAALIQPLAQSFLVTPDDPAAAPFWQSVGEAAERGYIESPRYRFTVAEQQGALVGFIALRDTWHVFHLFVAPAHQGQGLATRLWRQARAQAESAGGDHAAFTVNASLPAIGFYRRLGFQAAGDVHAAHGIRFQPMRLPPGCHNRRG